MNRLNQFIHHVRCHLEEHNFKLIFAKSFQVNTGTGYRCTGYFDESRRVIRIAKRSSNWFETLVHEYCHFLDWLESSSRQLQKEDKALALCEKYIKGDICHPQAVKYAFQTVARMEWKCDRRAVKLIQEWNLPIDISNYIREANLYVYLYHMYKKHKTFNNRRPSPRILAEMPDTFRSRSWYAVPAGLEEKLESLFV
jgi:hypothetical protein